MGLPDLESIVRTLIASGESFYVEFKSAWDYGPEGKQPRDLKAVARDIGGELVAFANADGGDLLVGVEDSGSITGIPWEGDKLRYLVQAPRQQVHGIDLGARVHEVLVDGQLLLLFRVQRYPQEAVVTADGRCLGRQGDRAVPMRPREVTARREEQRGQSYETEPIERATIDDLDLGSIDFLRDSRQRAPIVALRARSPEDLLRYWNLVEQRNGSVILKRAALLLFAKEPLRWHPNNRIRLRRVHGEDPGYGRSLVTREEEITSPLPEALVRASEVLLRQLEREVRQASLFAVDHLLPMEAVQECLVNAVAHRNYAIEGQAIEVLIYPDRLEFRSPGVLPAPLTIDDLIAQRGVHRSRNPLMMRVLRDLGWTRDQTLDLGEGIRRIFSSMRQMELHEPHLSLETDTFVVRLSTRSVYDPSTQAWIASYGPFGLVPEERRYMVALRREGGKLSVDRLARLLDVSFDEAKKVLQGLEHKHLVWRRRGSRTYILVDAFKVPHERALAGFSAAKIEVTGTRARDRVLDLDDLQAVLAIDSPARALVEVTRWKEAGILTPAGKKRWKLGPSFLEYVAQRR